jgi:hypothetical protein
VSVVSDTWILYFRSQIALTQGDYLGCRTELARSLGSSRTPASLTADIRHDADSDAVIHAAASAKASIMTTLILEEDAAASRAR